MTSAADPDTQTARADLAFMRALASDKDPLPTLYGAHLLAIGAVFGPTVLFTWAGVAGLVDAPAAWVNWGWAAATIVYLPILIVLLVRSRRGPGGPSQRAVWYAWAAVGTMTIAILVGFVGASGRVDPIFIYMWPPVALALYGGVWTLTALIRGARWHGLVALGCFLGSVACAWTATTPTQWLVLGLGLLLFIGGPGLAIILKARRTAA